MQTVQCILHRVLFTLFPLQPLHFGIGGVGTQAVSESNPLHADFFYSPFIPLENEEIGEEGIMKTQACTQGKYMQKVAAAAAGLVGELMLKLQLFNQHGIKYALEKQDHGQVIFLYLLPKIIRFI